MLYLSENLGSSQLLGCIGKIVKRWFFVDENLLVHDERMLSPKQADGHYVALIVFQSVKQMGSTYGAEPTLSPL